MVKQDTLPQEAPEAPGVDGDHQDPIRRAHQLRPKAAPELAKEGEVMNHIMAEKKETRLI